MVEFVTMDRAAAKAYLQQFQLETPAALDRLRALAETTGGPAAGQLDLSPQSLGPLWDWARQRPAWRAGWQPVPSGSVPRRITADELEPLDRLPSWFHHPSSAGYATFDADTLWLLDGLGRYLGQALVESVPKARWTAGNNRSRGYVYQNHPVVKVRGNERQPLHSTAIVVGRALESRPSNGPQSLTDLYVVWTS